MRHMTSDDLLAITDETNMNDVDVIEQIMVDCFDGSAVTTNRGIKYLHGFLHFNRRYNAPVSVKQIIPPDYLLTPASNPLEHELAIKVTYDFLKGKVPKHEIGTEWTRCMDVHTNGCITDLEFFGSSSDAEDFVELRADKEIMAMRKIMHDICGGNEGPDIKSNAIVDCNVKLIDYIERVGADLYPHNGTVQHIILKGFKVDQFCQLFNIVGYTTEINSDIHPILTLEAFADGMNYPYTFATNTSLGQKSIIYNKGPIALTETLNRSTQQMSSQLENIHIRDCGTTKTSRITITDNIRESIVGMYHMPPGEKVELLTKDVVTKYLGKVIQLRNISCCDEPDDVGICSICGGASSTNFVANYTVGGASSCLVFGRNSQKVLKTKHVELINFDSSETLAIEVRPFLSISQNGKEIYAKESITNGTISFLANRRRGPERVTHGQFLQTVFSVKSLDGAELTSFGEIESLRIDPKNGLDMELDEVMLKPGSTSHFSLELLQYVRANPSVLTMSPSGTNKTQYTIDLKGFNILLPLLTMPFKHYDALTLHVQLQTFFLSPSKKLPGEVLTDYDSFGSALIKLSDMVYSRLNVNMSILQMLLISFTMRDKDKGDYRMAFNGDKVDFGKLSFVRKHRSLSVVTIASDQAEVYGHMGPLVNDNMTPHQYDSHFC